EFSMRTWLALGALLEVALMSILPRTGAVLLPIAYMLYLILRVARNSRGTYTSYYKTVKREDGRLNVPWKGPVSPIKSSAFVLGARFNQYFPMISSPGIVDIANTFEDMWVELEANHEKWSFLARTATLVDVSDDEAITMAWLTYFTDEDKLQKFVGGAAHQLGQKGYTKGKWPHLGVMHEHFKAPRSCWETVYIDMPPWGLG
ncbi:hypothetical protein K458DRAFT_239535, partial [Lentithecium fluviatile CBS 122367]